MKNIVVLLAGGSGLRMNADLPKQHLIINQHQIIEYTLTAFSICTAVDYILVVSHPEYVNKIEDMKKEFPKLEWVIEGGSTRINSVNNAVRFLSEICEDTDNIIISDAARPCITNKEINDIIACLDFYIAVTTGVESYETILRTSNREILEIIPRDGIIRQTSPEGYKFNVLRAKYVGIDDSIIESYRNIGIDQLYADGEKIAIVKSNPMNFKITTMEDLYLFETVVKKGFKEFVQGYSRVW